MNHGSGIKMVGDDLGSTVSDRQQEIFEMVESKLEKIGIGSTKEVAKSFGTTICENIRVIDLNIPNLEEAQFGRKLYTNIRSMVRFGINDSLNLLIDSNYPVDKFLLKRAAIIASLQEEADRMDAAIDIPTSEPQREHFQFPADIAKGKALDELENRLRSQLSQKKTGKNEGEITFFSEKEKIDRTYDNEWKQKYMEAVEKYNTEVARAKISKRGKDGLVSEQNKSVIVNLLVEGHRNAMNVMCNKIKSCVNLACYSGIKTRLSCMVTLDSTGEMISNPFEGNNLAGICQILKNTYSKASLLSFNKDFSDTLHCSISEQDTLMNPVKAVQAVDLLVGQWTTMEYWKFMTSDIFFVNILLGALHSGSELKRKCVTEVNQYLAKREAGEISDDASVSDGGTGSAFGAMPVYVHLCEFLRREQESMRYGANTAAPAAGVKTPAKHSPYVRPDYRRSGNTESAASADIALL
jgi:hypothetical protein